MTNFEKRLLKYAYTTWYKTQKPECEIFIPNSDIFLQCCNSFPYLENNGYIERIFDNFDKDTIKIINNSCISDDLYAVFSIISKATDYVQNYILSKE